MIPLFIYIAIVTILITGFQRAKKQADKEAEERRQYYLRTGRRLKK
jgi:hypothetical protein